MMKVSEKENYPGAGKLDLDNSFIPALQHFLYVANGVYATTLDAAGNVIAELDTQTEEEREFLRRVVPPERMKEVAMSIENNFVEEIISVRTDSEYVVSEAVILRLDGMPKGVMIITGVISDSLEDAEIPASIKLTQLDEYERIVEMGIKVLSEYLTSSTKEQKAEILLNEMHQDSIKLEEDYVRSALITDIVQMLESEKDITKIVEEVFKMVCEYLEIDVADLYRINADNVTVSVISEWAVDSSYACMDKEQDIPIDRYPFFKGENFIISSNTDIKKEQKEFLDNGGIKAYIVFPIVLKNEIIMYLTFKCIRKERIFQYESVRFISDVRKILQSIIIKRVAQNSLTSSLSSLEDILGSMECAIYVIDPITRNLLFYNEVFDKKMNDELKKIRLADFFEHGEVVVEYEVKPLNRWLELRQKSIAWVDGREVELYTIYDITKNKIYEYNLEKSTNVDSLTGLFNRMRCEQDLAVYMNLAKENKEKGALIFMDLDDFKHINDGLGHQYGDILLKAIGTNLRHIRGVENTCYRVGGDEFVCIVTGKAYSELNVILQSIENMFSHPWLLKGGEYYCTASSGVCRFPSDADVPADAIRKADIALSEAKRGGKNKIAFYDSETINNEVKRLDMEKALRLACIHPEEEFEVYYQPIIDVTAEGEKCIGAEALVRWNSPELGRLNPGDFIPVAEDLGVITQIGDFVLREACTSCKHWNDMGNPDFKVNVNFSVVQLLQNDMKDKILEVLKETGLEPKNLTLEVTESLAINDITYMKKILGNIKKSGVKVALDDFGTGYSSLNHIHEMPIDIIKVDRCFVRDVGKDEYSHTFVRMVTELAKVMDMNVCVEGVEEKSQLDIVKESKVDMIQGFYFAEPMPFDEFEAKFINH
ncbi:MAG: bifunctional diguanylate cyclase/phosphodiesterase [Lachnospiraceae bacterium]|nr:bifunctional diguanylate cyclase/phosphodiesterase [Lachnospiraceae bacterium]